MFSSDFEKIYTEAFTAATGRSLDTPDTQQEYIEQTAQTREALLDRWTAPDFDSSPITDETSSRRSRTFRIKHPETYSFTEEDAQDIAHIRFFGAQVLSAAQKSLQENEYIDPNNSARFDAKTWYSAHPDQPFEKELGWDSDAPSPQRLKEWPHGDYLNCLGISIATAAESANEATPFVYMNRLRDARHELSKEAIKFFERLDTVCPEAYKIESILHISDAFNRGATGDDHELSMKRYLRCIREEQNYVQIKTFQMNADSSFHHAILREDNESLYRTWTQFDPYAILDCSINPYPLEKVLTNDKLLREEGACNEILLLSGDMQKVTSESIGRTVDVAIRSQTRLRRLLEDYKSPSFMENLYNELVKCDIAMFVCNFIDEESVKTLSDDMLFEQSDGMITKHSLRYTWLEILRKAAMRSPKGSEIFLKMINSQSNDTEKTQVQKYFKIIEDGREEVVSKNLADALATLMRHDSVTRAEFAAVIEAMPFASALHRAERTIEMSLFGGESDSAMEVGDPAFMIGSMYLNHYARWDKDGKVNVAKELARINPSQLIWQAAVSQEGGIVVDDRVASLGALVKSFRNSQQHPLVRITQPKKEYDNGRKETVAREGGSAN